VPLYPNKAKMAELRPRDGRRRRLTDDLGGDPSRFWRRAPDEGLRLRLERDVVHGRCAAVCAAWRGRAAGADDHPSTILPSNRKRRARPGLARRRCVARRQRRVRSRHIRR
jgi:hypothetical protein